MSLRSRRSCSDRVRPLGSNGRGGNGIQWLVLLALAFAALYCVPAMRLPLWLDEILQLLLTRPVIATGSFVTNIADSAGGVPLGYFAQAGFIHLVGYSVFAARCPSVLSSVLSAIGMGVLGMQAGLKRPAMALCLFCLLPLQVRYAWEARPYELALCLSIWSTVLFRRLVDRPGMGRTCAYSGVGILAVYAQPFAIFTVGAQELWLAIAWMRTRNLQIRSALRLSVPATLLVGLSFLPWLVFARSHWHAAIKAADLASSAISSPSGR